MISFNSPEGLIGGFKREDREDLDDADVENDDGPEPVPKSMEKFSKIKA